MFVVTKQEMVSEAQTRALNVPRCKFSQRVGCGNKMARNHPKHEFQTKSSGLGMFATKKQETVLEAQTRALNVPRYRFLQRVKCGYEMAWNHPKHEF